MTFTNQTNRTSAVGTGAEQVIPFTFPITDNSDIVVTQRVTATGVETTLVETTNYTVTNNGTSGGSITTVTPFVAVSAQIHIVRDTPNTQQLDLVQGGSFNAENIEVALDKNAKLTAESEDGLDRTLKFPTTDPSSSFSDMPNSIDRASKNLTFDSSGKPAASVSVNTGSVSFTSIGEDIAGAANEAAVRDRIVLGTTDNVEFAAVTASSLIAPTATITSINGTTATLNDLITKSPWFDVRAFGAVGDGVTDNLIAIQAAVDAALATATGGVVFFPAGLYSIDNGSINVTNNGNRSIWFVGAGMYSARIVKTTTGTGDTIIWNCTGNPSGIQNLGIVAASGGNFSIDGISTTTGMNGVFFENVWMGGFSSGFVLSGTDIHITNCISEQNNLFGFVFDKNIRAVNCKSFLNGNGFLLKYSTSPSHPDEPCVLIACDDSDSGNVGIDIDSRDNVEIIGFTVSSSGFSLNTGIRITGSNQIKIIGGNIRLCSDSGILFAGACNDVVINGMTIQEIGVTTDGVGIQMVGGSNRVLVSNCIFKEIRLSAIKTGNSSNTRITNNIISSFGRNETAGNKFGVLIDGDASFKGATVSSNNFVLATAETQTGISFGSSAQGKFFIRENEFINGTLMDLTNAPANTIVEQNQDGYVLTALADEATPSAKGRRRWKTGGTTTITDLDDTYAGQEIIIVCKHSLTFDFTTAQDADHNLDGSSADITADTGDILVFLSEDGTTLRLISYLDASVDNN